MNYQEMDINQKEELLQRLINIKRKRIEERNYEDQQEISTAFSHKFFMFFIGLANDSEKSLIAESDRLMDMLL